MIQAHPHPRQTPWRRLALPGLLVILALLQGCAGTARGTATSAYRFDDTLEVLDRSRSAADAWVVLRYPAMLEAGAEAAWFDAYAREAIGGRMRDDGWTSADTENIARASIAKSNFFAMSLYRELREQLPPDTVLLSPHLVYETVEGALASRPLLATEALPSVLTIDFLAYSFPDGERMMDAPPVTFGDLVTPLAVVHGDHWLRPPTNGLLLASEPLVDTAWRRSAELAAAEFAGRLAAGAILDERSLDFVDYLNGDRPLLDIPRKPVRENTGDLAAVEVYPVEKIQMDGTTFEAWVDDPSADPFRAAFARGVGSRVEAALGRFDHDRATFADRQKLLAAFDPELATAFLAHSEDESVRARLALAETLMAAERRFLAAQSERLFQGVSEGSYGRAMRELIAAEYRNLEERRALARRQNAATAIAIIAMAGAAYAGSETWEDGSFDAGKALVSDVLLLGAFAAVESAISAHQLNDQVGEGFLSQMAPAMTEQITVGVQLAEGTQRISARDYAEFRRQTLALYQSRIRSLTVDLVTDCVFRHPEAATQGRWYGPCRNGLALGRGYGVIRTDTGREIEFLGEAGSGTANGRGAMIVHEPGMVGAAWLEGAFRDGRPHGTLRVARPGETPELRRFEDGAEVGRGDPADWRPFRFQ